MFSASYMVFHSLSVPVDLSPTDWPFVFNVDIDITVAFVCLGFSMGTRSQQMRTRIFTHNDMFH